MKVIVIIKTTHRKYFTAKTENQFLICCVIKKYPITYKIIPLYNKDRCKILLKLSKINFHSWDSNYRLMKTRLECPELH